MYKKPFESDGSFYCGHVQRAGTESRRYRRRIMCFVTKRGFVGASADFIKPIAFANAMNAQRVADRASLVSKGALMFPETLTTVLRKRGFPVRNSDDGIDEDTARYLSAECKRT